MHESGMKPQQVKDLFACVATMASAIEQLADAVKCGGGVGTTPACDEVQGHCETIRLIAERHA